MMWSLSLSKHLISMNISYLIQTIRYWSSNKNTFSIWNSIPLCYCDYIVTRPLLDTFSKPEPTQLGFENHWLSGNLDYWVYQKYPEIPSIPGNTRLNISFGNPLSALCDPSDFCYIVGGTTSWNLFYWTLLKSKTMCSWDCSLISFTLFFITLWMYLWRSSYSL